MVATLSAWGKGKCNDGTGSPLCYRIRSCMFIEDELTAAIVS